MPKLRDIHGEQYNHAEPCPDLFCCKCECQTCKRAWWAAGRPHPKDCPVHGKLPDEPAAPPPKPLKTRIDFLQEEASLDREAVEERRGGKERRKAHGTLQGSVLPAKKGTTSP